MIIVLIGRMASGKDTVINAINKELKIPILVSHTTRPMRPGETNHKEYHFVDNNYFLEDFNTKIAFSWSTDGIYGTYERERKELKQEYYKHYLVLVVLLWRFH